MNRSFGLICTFPGHFTPLENGSYVHEKGIPHIAQILALYRLCASNTVMYHLDFFLSTLVPDFPIQLHFILAL